MLDAFRSLHARRGRQIGLCTYFVQIVLEILQESLAILVSLDERVPFSLPV